MLSAEQNDLITRVGAGAPNSRMAKRTKVDDDPGGVSTWEHREYFDLA